LLSQKLPRLEARMTTSPKYILALDYGTSRIGVALASTAARLPEPLTTIYNDPKLFDNIRQIAKEQDISQVVVGLPRDMRGERTQQTALVEAFVDKLAKEIELPIEAQDEAVTSIKAEEELVSRNKNYTKEDIDALSAAYILEDWLKDHDQEIID
jgi:putative Holliday junction resolvase